MYRYVYIYMYIYIYVYIIIYIYMCIYICLSDHPLCTLHVHHLSLRFVTLYCVTVTSCKPCIVPPHALRSRSWASVPCTREPCS